jgi:hypothetical protein
VNGLGVARAQVHAELVAVLEGAGLLPADAIHAFVPDELALPAVWIVSPFGIREADLATVTAVVGVIVAVDGAEQSQLAALDELESACWVALDRVGQARLATPTVLVAGGPTVHAVTLNADVDVAVRTLCVPVLERSSSSRRELN